MVKKLFKYEWKYYVRLLPVAYLILLTVAASVLVINLASVAVEQTRSEDLELLVEVADTMTNLTFGAVLCAVAVFSFAVVLIRFYKHLFSAEGYLTLTLPVTSAQHLAVKTVSAVAVNTLTTLVVLATLAVTGVLQAIVELFGYFFGPVTVLNAVVWTVLLLALWVATMFATTLRYYAYIALGQLFRKHRILASVGLGVACYFIRQTIATVLYVVGLFALVFVDEFLPTYFWENGGLIGLIIVWTLLTAGWAVLEFLLIKWVISKKLDLE